MTPRSSPGPGRGTAAEPGAGKGGETTKNDRAVPWKRNRGCGDFLSREEGAEVEVARWGLRWPEAPAAAAREDAAGGSDGPRHGREAVPAREAAPGRGRRGRPAVLGSGLGSRRG